MGYGLSIINMDLFHILEKAELPALSTILSICLEGSQEIYLEISEHMISILVIGAYRTSKCIVHPLDTLTL